MNALPCRSCCITITMKTPYFTVIQTLFSSLLRQQLFFINSALYEINYSTESVSLISLKIQICVLNMSKIENVEFC